MVAKAKTKSRYNKQVIYDRVTAEPPVFRAFDIGVKSFLLCYVLASSLTP